MATLKRGSAKSQQNKITECRVGKMLRYPLLRLQTLSLHRQLSCSSRWQTSGPGPSDAEPRNYLEFVPPQQPEMITKERNRRWKKHQRFIRSATIQKVPEEDKVYDKAFDNVLTYEKQLEALRKRGFLRAYKPYQPPQDFESRFMKVCAETLGLKPNEQVNLSNVKLERSQKGKVLKQLESEFNHSVPNSMVHIMSSMDQVFLFYSTPVDVRTPYERLYDEKSKGNVPKNLHIQLRAKRFDGTNDNILDQVTAFPGSSTILVTPEARKKYKDTIASRQLLKNSINDKMGCEPYYS